MPFHLATIWSNGLPPLSTPARFGSTAAQFAADNNVAGSLKTIGTIGTVNNPVRASFCDGSGNVTASFTIEWWFNMTNSGRPWRPMVVFTNGGSSPAAVGWDSSSSPVMTVENVLGNYSTPVGWLNDDSWHHIALVVTSTTSRLYLDGSQLASGSRSGVIQPDMWIGGYNDQNGMGGAIDELRIKAGEVYTGSTYTVPSAAFTPDSSTVALYHFDSLNNVVPAAAYSLTEGTGTAVDATFFAHNMTGSSWTTGGYYGGAAINGSFSGSPFGSTGVRTTNVFTLMTWAKITDTTYTSNLMRSDNNDAWFEVPTNLYEHYIVDHVEAVGATTTLALNTWAHICLVVDGVNATATLYRNGTQSASYAWSQNAIDLGGNWYLGGPDHLIGLMNDARLFDYALSSSEISAWMNTPVAAITAIPYAWMRFG